MKKLIIIFLFLMSVSLGNAQKQNDNNYQIINVPGIDWINNVIFFNQYKGFVSGENGVFTTSNGGQTWNRVFGDSNIRMYDAVKLQNSSTAFVVGSTEDLLHIYVLTTTNAGATWSTVTIPGNNIPYAVTSYSNTVDIVCNSNSVVRSTNSGQSWQEHIGNPAWNFVPSDAVRLGNVLFVSLGRLYRSRNLLDWQDVGLLDQSHNGVAVEGLTQNGEVVFGAGYKTAVPTDILSMNEHFKKSTDGARVYVPGYGYMKAIDFINLRSTFDLPVPTICYSKNLGKDWTKVFLPGNGYMTQVGFANSNVGYSTGTEIDTVGGEIISTGVVYETNNGGKRWRKVFETDSIEYGMRSIEIINNKAIFSFGSKLLVLRNHNNDAVEVDSKEDTPQQKLEQNYPNPFNPVTQISFSLAVSGMVKLSIYDITGREVKALVNESKSAGNYTVDFNGSELSSGVYFYKLETGNFRVTKRMTLIK